MSAEMPGFIASKERHYEKKSTDYQRGGKAHRRTYRVPNPAALHFRAASLLQSRQEVSDKRGQAV